MAQKVQTLLIDDIDGGAGTTEMRAWARSQGIEVKDRGRIPAGIVARYREATGK